MIEELSLFVLLFFSALASYYDLKTTEIPDSIPAFLVTFFVLLLIVKYFESPVLLLQNLGIGIAYSLLGVLMYLTGQWGGGDAQLLAAYGFSLPLISKFFLFTPSPPPITFLTNLFLVGAFYMLFYSFMFSLREKSVWEFLRKDLEGKKMKLFYFFFVVLIGSACIQYFFLQDIIFTLTSSASLSLSLVCLYIVWRFAVAVEKKGFRKKVKVSELKVGDVLLKSKRWDGITEEQLKKIRKSGKKYVWIKTGVCFAPAFPLSLLVCMFYGNLFFFFLPL